MRMSFKHVIVNDEKKLDVYIEKFINRKEINIMMFTKKNMLMVFHRF